MLAELSIKNFAIIEALSLSFEKGLTVLTGETGAGKSIIIDAIQLLSGGRGSSDYVRFGENKAEIEGLFFVDEQHKAIKKLEELGIESSEGMIVLQRNISHTGKSVCRINNKLVTLGILREIGGTLIDIHSQHEHQDLMQSENHVTLLDEYGKKLIYPALQEYRKLYDKFNQLNTQRKHLSENEQKIAHRLDLIQYQLKEITEANLMNNEDEQLSEEKVKLSNFEKLYESIGSAYEALSQDNKGLDWVGHAMGFLDGVSELDRDLENIHEAIANSFYVLEDATSQLRDKLDHLEFNPARLDEIEERLNEINMLKRKYGDSIESILEYAAGIEEEIETLSNREKHISELEKELKDTAAALQLEGKNLRAIRKKVADSLVEHIHTELKSLYMDKTTFAVQFTPLETNQANVNFSKNGIDQIEFFISTNPGEPLKPLTKTASGGELSRIMLALKTIFSNQQGITSIIFDEVDTGVSGRVAQAMAEKIQQLSITSQVFCITHLPQVAAIADSHLYISKEITNDNRTVTHVKKLSENEKVKEVARMISGVEMTKLTKQHAKELIKLASKNKSSS